MVLWLEKDSQTEQDEIINSRFSSDLLLLASDTYPPIDANTVKFSAMSSEGDKYAWVEVNYDLFRMSQVPLISPLRSDDKDVIYVPSAIQNYK